VADEKRGHYDRVINSPNPALQPARARVAPGVKSYAQCFVSIAIRRPWRVRLARLSFLLGLGDSMKIIKWLVIYGFFSFSVGIFSFTLIPALATILIQHSYVVPSIQVAIYRFSNSLALHLVLMFPYLVLAILAAISRWKKGPTFGNLFISVGLVLLVIYSFVNFIQFEISLKQIGKYNLLTLMPFLGLIIIALSLLIVVFCEQLLIKKCGAQQGAQPQAGTGRKFTP